MADFKQSRQNVIAAFAKLMIHLKTAKTLFNFLSKIRRLNNMVCDSQQAGEFRKVLC